MAPHITLRQPVPELPEVESYRQLADKSALRRQIRAVETLDPRYLRGSGRSDVGAALTGRRFVAARRIGKLVLLDTDGGPTVGLHFGMTGSLAVDGVEGVDGLLYTPRRVEPGWERFVVRFADGGRLTMRDPRRFGRLELDPDENRLGVDLLALTPASLTKALTTSRAPLKARLLDQSRIAGIGNLIADEALWRSGLDPARPAGSLTAPERRRLHRHLRATTADLMARGGSHTGDFLPARQRDGRCPRDGAPLLRRSVGGRTTFSCPVHQR
jgi:formamidopyrimidine-DNA glycosylase